MKIGIIGGGLMGMALAQRLTSAGNQVDVFESDSQLGGLATYSRFGNFFWDRFYHVILPSDRHLIAFIDDIGLGGELRWRQTRTGFFVDQRMHSISNSVEFLQFPLLSMIDKFRLALTMLYSSRITDWQSLEETSVEDWLIRVSGKRTYEKMWRPLLLAKLGDNYKRVSAVFIWSYIKRLFSARDASASKEQLGHVSGGYKMVFEQLTRFIETAGGRVLKNAAVESIEPAEGKGLQIRMSGKSEAKTFDKVVCTSPVPVLQSIASESLLKTRSSGGNVEYLGVVCAVLITTRPIVPFYVVNIADETIPFTGIIGMSSVVSTEYTAGKYLTYLPKYVISTDDWLDKDDAEIEKEFLNGLRRMLPDFDPSTIDSVVVNRARRVQPLQVINYSKIVPQVETQHPDFFALNTAQFLNATLNNNEVIGAVNQFLRTHGEGLGIVEGH